MANSTLKPEKTEFMIRLRDWLSNPVFQLIYMTLVFGMLTFGLFWLTIKFHLLPIELMKPDLSQEDTGLFSALGGWAIGFAGAIVAIRIAGIAKNIQLNDSIREEMKLWEVHVERISDLNSRLTRSIFDCKRACAAVLLHAKESSVGAQSRPHMFNPMPNKSVAATKAIEADDPEKTLQENLKKKLEQLVETIEEVLQDSVFRSVLTVSAESENDYLLFESWMMESEDCDSASKLSEECNFVEAFFKEAAARNAVKEIVAQDNRFINTRTLEKGFNRGARNFGIGLVELGAMRLMTHFREDLWRLTKYQQQKENFEISDVAWLFMGLLLSRAKKDSDASRNDGFIMIALLLGTLPTEDSIKRYLDGKLKKVEKIYSAEGKKTMETAIEELSKRCFFIKGQELSELAALIEICGNNLEYLDVLTKSSGVSAAFDKNVLTKNSESGNEKSSKSEGDSLLDHKVITNKNQPDSNNGIKKKEIDVIPD